MAPVATERGDRPIHACLVCGAEQEFLFGSRRYSYYRCCRCRLVSTLPIPDSDELTAHYARNYAEGNYAVREHQSRDYLRVYEAYALRLERALARFGKQLAGSAVLDVGCFTGEFLEILKGRGADVYGVEIQPEAARVADRRLPGRIWSGDLFGARFPVAEFDVITAFAVVEHLPEPLRLLSRCAELLRPGGILMLETPDSGSLMARAMGRHWPPYTPVEHIHLFSRDSLRRALRHLGFSEPTCTPHWKWLTPSYVYRMLQTFGPDFRRLLEPVSGAIPRACGEIPLPFYIGEIIAIARKAEPIRPAAVPAKE